MTVVDIDRICLYPVGDAPFHAIEEKKPAEDGKAHHGGGRRSVWRQEAGPFR